MPLPRDSSFAPQDDRLKIAYLDHTAKLGGGEIALLHLVQELNPDRFHPVVLLGAEGELHQKLIASGIETHVLSLPTGVGATRKDTLGLRGLLRLGLVWRSLTYTRQVALWLRQQQIDVLHTNSLKADFIGGLPGAWRASR